MWRTAVGLDRVFVRGLPTPIRAPAQVVDQSPLSPFPPLSLSALSLSALSLSPLSLSALSLSPLSLSALSLSALSLSALSLSALSLSALSLSALSLSALSLSALSLSALSLSPLSLSALSLSPLSLSALSLSALSLSALSLSALSLSALACHRHLVGAVRVGLPSGSRLAALVVRIRLAPVATCPLRSAQRPTGRPRGAGGACSPVEARAQCRWRSQPAVFRWRDRHPLDTGSGALAFGAESGVAAAGWSPVGVTATSATGDD